MSAFGGRRDDGVRDGEVEWHAEDEKLRHASRDRHHHPARVSHSAHVGYRPWALGVLVQIGGACYVVNSFLVLITPDIASIVFLVPSFVAELSLAIWLLVRGVDAPKWMMRVHGAPTT